MQRQLVVIAGPDQGHVFPLVDGQTLVIGRGQTSQTQLKDPRVSRVHCSLQVETEKILLIDAGSAGGTMVDGEPVTRHELKPGEIIQVGGTQLRFVMEGAQDESTMLEPFDPKPKPKTTPLKDLVGESFAHFTLEAIIAPGVTGMVFRAHDTQADRPAAVKVLSPEFTGTAEQRERFVRAIKTMLPVRHENLVELYAAGKRGPYCWVAMEYVKGENLMQVIDRIGAAGMLDWRNSFRVALHVGRALEAAYEHQIIHRNVTPTNILQHSSDRWVKLGDLTLAKAIEGTLARQITRPGELVGDVAYMSPERTREGAEVDGRSDIYGLGATLYALLTGRPPLEARSLPELVTKIRDEKPAPPKDYQMSIPDLFQDLVLWTLAKRPEDRPQTPTDLLRDLERVAKYQGLTDF